HSTTCSPSTLNCTCQPRSATRFDSGSTMSIVTTAGAGSPRLKRMPRMPAPCSCFNSASVTVGWRTATPRAPGPSCAIASPGTGFRGAWVGGAMPLLQLGVRDRRVEDGDASGAWTELRDRIDGDLIPGGVVARRHDDD